jgi:hypothetical protein
MDVEFGRAGTRTGKKEKQIFTSPEEHHLLQGLPEGWELEAVPRGYGTKHVDYYWLSPPDPRTGRAKRLRSMNEVRAFLNPETAVHERAKRIDHEKEQIRKVVDALLIKVEKRCIKIERLEKQKDKHDKAKERKDKAPGGGPGGHRPRFVQRTAAEFMQVRMRRHIARNPAAPSRARALRACVRARRSLCARPPPGSPDPRDLSRRSP